MTLETYLKIKTELMKSFKKSYLASMKVEKTATEWYDIEKYYYERLMEELNKL